MKFGLIGAGGYIAPRHMAAINAVGGRLVAACDVSDSVGVLDRYAEDCAFFTELGPFIHHCREVGVEWLTICSPNYQHALQAEVGMHNGMNVICEKPLCVDPADIARLREVEARTGRRVFTVLQLRLNPTVDALRERSRVERVGVNLQYITRRGPWYWKSWKGSTILSGGLLMNIGIHFFDLMLYLFGNVRSASASWISSYTALGLIELEWADVEWKLSVDKSQLPEGCHPTFRALRVEHPDGSAESIDLSDGFEDAHVATYRHTLAGQGWGLADVEPSIKLVHRLTDHRLADVLLDYGRP